jgi:hypothetical protein
MHGRWRNEAERQSVLYNQNTETAFIGFNPAFPTDPPLPFWQRFLHGLGSFCVATVRKINQLLMFALLVLLLLLLARFLLHFFGVYTGVNLFSQEIFFLSEPLIVPFDHLFAPLPYQGYSIDITTTLTLVVYTVSVIIVRQFLKKLLVSRPK